LTPRQKALKAARNQHLVINYINYLLERRGQAFQVTDGILLETHRLTIGDMYPCAGSYRDAHFQVTLNGRQVPPAYTVQYSVRDLLDGINKNEAMDSTRRAAKLHYGLTAIHPFNGGNGRVARALMALLLRRDGLPQFAVVNLLSWIKRNRQPYIDSLRTGERNFFLYIMYGLLSVYEKVFRRPEQGDKLRAVRSLKKEVRRSMKQVVSRQLRLF